MLSGSETEESIAALSFRRRFSAEKIIVAWQAISDSLEVVPLEMTHSVIFLIAAVALISVNVSGKQFVERYPPPLQPSRLLLNTNFVLNIFKVDSLEKENPTPVAGPRPSLRSGDSSRSGCA